MTTLVRPVKRVTGVRIQNRALCIEVGPFEIKVRQKGRRTGYSVPLEAIWHIGGKLERRRLDAEKKARKARR